MKYILHFKNFLYLIFKYFISGLKLFLLALLFSIAYIVHLINLTEKYREENPSSDDIFTEESSLEDKPLKEIKSESKRLLEESDEWTNNDKTYENVINHSYTKDNSNIKNVNIEQEVVIPGTVIKDYIPLDMVDDSNKGKAIFTVPQNPHTDENVLEIENQAQLEISEFLKKNVTFSTKDYNWISNMKAYVDNNAIKDTNAQIIELDSSDIDTIKLLVNNLSSESIPDNDKQFLWKNILKENGESINSSSSSVFSRIVEEIRSGHSISIYSPSENDIFSPGTVVTEEKTKDSDQELVLVEKPKREVLIVTKKLEEGEPIPHLPSWTGTMEGDVDYPVKRRRLDNMFYNDFQNTKVDDTKPSDKNQQWLEDDSNYNISNLYSEKYIEDSKDLDSKISKPQYPDESSNQKNKSTEKVVTQEDLVKEIVDIKTTSWEIKSKKN
jgi:hypothetical protein